MAGETFRHAVLSHDMVHKPDAGGHGSRHADIIAARVGLTAAELHPHGRIVPMITAASETPRRD